jgi:large subunit ribosomal protein L35
LTKRFKVTKTGKILRRATGQDHFRAKKSGKLIRAKKKWIELSKPEAKKIKKLMSV